MGWDILADMEKWWEKSRKYNPAAPLIEKTMKTDSQNVRRIGNAIGWDWLENEAAANSDDPKRGIARASLATAGIFAAPYVYGALGGKGAAAASTAAKVANAANTASSVLGPGVTAMTQEQLAEQAIQRALAEQAAQEAAQRAATSASTGMFAQVPGAGPEQTAYLNAQMGDAFGGHGADLTAKAAMPAVRDAYNAGKMGTVDYLGNVAKADLAGMNDLSVWGDRFASNAKRLAGNYGRNLATRGMAPQQSRYQPVPQQPQRPAPQQQPGEDLQKVLADFKAGKISEDELRRRLEAMGVMA